MRYSLFSYIMYRQCVRQVNTMFAWWYFFYSFVVANGYSFSTKMSICLVSRLKFIIFINNKLYFWLIVSYGLYRIWQHLSLRSVMILVVFRVMKIPPLIDVINDKTRESSVSSLMRLYKNDRYLLKLELTKASVLQRKISTGKEIA